MEYLSVTEQQTNLVRTVPEDIEQITRHALCLFDRLRNLVAQPFIQRSWGLSLTSLGNGPLAELSTPFGLLRMDLVPFVDDRGVQGRYVIEKQGRSELGEVIWQRVWSLRLDKDGRVFQGDEVTTSIPSRLRFSGEDIEIAKLALSILYVAGTELK